MKSPTTHSQTAGKPGKAAGRNLIDGPILPTIILFSLPMLGSNILQSLSMTMNAVWVSHILGPAALTATVNAQIIMMMLMGAVFGVGMAANIVLAQEVGAGNMRDAKRVVGTAMGFFVAASIMLAGIGFVLSPMMLNWMNTPQDAHDQAVIYLRYTCLTMPFSFTFLFAQMLMRGTGDSQTPFSFSLLHITLSIILTPLFIVGALGFPRFGIAGAAMGNLVAQAIALTGLLVHVYRADLPVALKGPDLKLLFPDFAILKVFVLRGIPMGLQMFVISGASLVLLAMVNQHGSDVAAAYGAATQLWAYLQMPAMALSASVSSIAAQNIGANRWDRVEQLAKSSVFLGLGITVASILLIYALGDLPMQLFLPASSNALKAGMEINSIVLWSWAPFAIAFVLFGIVRANGATVPPTAILFVTLWLVRVPFAEFLQPALGRAAIWWSFPVGTIGAAALAVAYYRWGKWREKTISPANFGRTAAPIAEVAAAHPEAFAETPDGATAAMPVSSLSPAILRQDAETIAALRREIEAMRARLALADETRNA
ncbi:MAG: MATE family efflux transporter [Caulobacterales bacterium]